MEYQSLTDGRLLDLFAEARDKGAFGEIFRRYYRLVWSSCSRNLNGHENLVEDAVQAVFVFLFRKGRIPGGCPLSVWFYQTARSISYNAIRMETRRLAREKKAVENMRDTEPNPVSDVSWGEVRGCIDDAVNKLPDKQRDAVIMHYLAGKSLVEISSETGILKDTLKKRVEAGIERLRSMLSNRGMSVSSGGLISLVAANAIEAAPKAMEQKIFAGVMGNIVTGGSAAGSTVNLLVDGMVRSVFISKCKTAAAIILAVLLPISIVGIAAGKSGFAIGGNRIESAALPAADLNTIVIDSNKRYQTITGFGAMLYPYAERYTDPRFPELFARDCGCSMARMEICPDLMKEAPQDLDAFLADPIDKTIGQMNFKSGVISVVGEVIKPIADKRIDEFRLIASVWSPPKWMKDNNSCVKGGKLREDRREHFAKYLATFCKGFEKVWGVPIYAVSIQNELMFSEPYNSCVYKPDSTEYHDAVLAVAKEFRKYDISTRLYGPEHMNNDARGGFFYGGNMKYIRQIANDPETLNVFIAWAFHGYAADGQTEASSRKGWLDYYADLSGYKKEIWMTETSGADPKWIHSDKNGRPDGALTIGLALHDALVAGNLNAWTFWSFQDGEKFSTYNLTAKGDTSAKKLNAARQYFRYIRPGAVRVGATPDNPDMNVCAFIHDTQKTLTVVLTNMEKADQKINLSVPANLNMASFKVFRTTESENFQAQPDSAVSGCRALVEVPAESIVTLVGESGR